MCCVVARWSMTLQADLLAVVVTGAVGDLSWWDKGRPLPGGMRESAARMASTRSPLPFRPHAQ